MAAPTFVDENESVFNTSTTPKTTGSISVNTGEVLIDCLADENFQTGDAYTISNSGTAQTWTEVIPAVSNNADCFCQIASAVSSVTASMTITGTRNAGVTTDWWGHNVLRYSGSDGVGASAPSATAQSVAVTTTQADSSIVVVVVDWSGGDWGGTRPWVAIGGVNAVEMSYFRDASHYTLGVARYEGVGATGAKTAGLTGLSGTFACVAIEVLGSAGGATVNGVANAALGGTFTASGIDRAIGAALAALGFTGTALGEVGGTVLGQAAANFGGTFAATGLRSMIRTISDTVDITDTDVPTILDITITLDPEPVGITDGVTTLLTRAGQAVANFGFTGTALGIVEGAATQGQAVGAFGGTFTALGRDRALGVAVASLGFTGTALGADRALGAISTSFSFTATAIGRPRIRGLATAVFAFNGDITVPAPTFLFSPPTHEEPIRTNVLPLRYFRLTYAKSVVRVDGHFEQFRYPSAALLAAAGEAGVDYFIGGYEYVITQETANELIADGFTPTSNV